MIDLVCLVADKNIDAAVGEVLERPEALGIRPLDFETLVHPRRDPGCFHESAELLSGYRGRAGHALVVLDRAWDGAPAGTGRELEEILERSESFAELRGWARAVVIDPELEAWVFGDSPHVARALGWPDDTTHLRRTLRDEGFWDDDLAKPADPKAAVEWALYRVRKPRSSSVYRDLAATVSLNRCRDRSFLRLTELLRGWFGGDGGKEV